MALIEINRNPSARELRWFGLLFALFFGLLAGILWWRFELERTARVLIWIGAVGAVVYYALPPLRRHFYVGFILLAFPIGWVVSYVVLLIAYFLVFTPIGLALRLLGKDPIVKRPDPRAESYWIARKTQTDPARYFKQY